MKCAYLLSSVVMASGMAVFGAAAPSISQVAIKQRSQHKAQIDYVLSNAPAIVLLDLQTNTLSDASGEWVSVGTEAIFGADNSCTHGANTIVAENGAHRITCTSPFVFGGDGIDPIPVRPVLKAVSPGNAPAYLVVRLAERLGAKDRLMWFEEDSLPGGVLGNADYRQTSLLLKRVRAKNVTFASGNPLTLTAKQDRTDLAPHAFTFPHDFYMGVFEFTQKQWETVCGSASQAHFKVQGDMRPMEKISFCDIRESVNNEADERYEYPNAPCPDSCLGKLRKLTACAAFPDGIDFDLPFESEWEFTARAGLPDGYWNNGEPHRNNDSPDSNMPGRSHGHGNPPGSTSTSVGPEGGTAICGTYAPSLWGFYDFHGNVFEWCLDWSVADISTLTGLVNANGRYLADGETVGELRAARGCAFTSHDSYSRACLRYKEQTTMYAYDMAERRNTIGFRVKCGAGLK